MLDGDVEPGQLGPADPAAALNHLAEGRRQHPRRGGATEIDAEADVRLPRRRRAEPRPEALAHHLRGGRNRGVEEVHQFAAAGDDDHRAVEA